VGVQQLTGYRLEWKPEHQEDERDAAEQNHDMSGCRARIIVVTPTRRNCHGFPR
jgi:hypothetical protein